MQKEKTVDVLIPVYRPGKEMEKLLDMLDAQTYPIREIRIVNTDRDQWNFGLEERHSRIQVRHISKDEFDHAATRASLAAESQADYMVFMTQDAVPENRYLIEELMQAFEVEGVKLSYARQLPSWNCREAESFARNFNYPAKGRIKSREDLPRLGIKTYFCSDVCAAYEKKTFQELGGFVKRAVFNEDMIYAAKVIQSGGKIAYAARARVIHSHNYTYRQQFHRNFDLGASQAEHPEVFKGVSSEGEGLRLLAETLRHLYRKKQYLQIPDFLMGCVFRYAGFFLGKRCKRMPKQLLLACTGMPEYWRREGSSE